MPAKIRVLEKKSNVQDCCVVLTLSQLGPSPIFVLFLRVMKNLLDKFDAIVSHLAVDILGERKGLSSFLFHGVFKDQKEISQNHIYSQERLTVPLFRQFLEYYLSSGYSFVSPEMLQEAKLETSKNYGLITFDDGYANNQLVLDVLKEYDVPAVFFVPTSFVQNGEKLWSDILYFERKKNGASDQSILQEIKSLRPLRLNKIKDYIVKEFGHNAFKPLGDIDRFLTEKELKAFASHRQVFIGNHTHSHEGLTLLTKEEIEMEFSTSQRLLKEMIGYAPYFVSYPYGDYSQTALEVAKQHFSLGITTVQKKNPYPLFENPNSNLLLSRFNPVAENGTLSLKKLRSNIQVKTTLKEWLQ